MVKITATKTKKLTPSSSSSSSPDSNKAMKISRISHSNNNQQKEENDDVGPLVSASSVVRRYSCSGGPTALRVLVLDLPLFLMLALSGAMAFIFHVHDQYWHAQIQALMWTAERKSRESTYYTRQCKAEDMSTKRGSDLFLSPNATAQEALEHQLQHGFTIFKNVLSPTTTLNLRNHIVSRNQNLSQTPGESLFVMDQQNRYSFTPNMATEVPFQRALAELTTHVQLNAAVAAILGPDPALLEIAPITNTFGAENQGWHVCCVLVDAVLSLWLLLLLWFVLRLPHHFSL
jgi:hypothetical protein